MSKKNLSYRIIEKHDLPDILSWFQEDHIKSIWPLEDYSLQYLEKKYIEEQEVLIFSMDQTPFGFVSLYKVEDHRDWWPYEVPGTIGFDYFIGHPDYLRKGLAKPMIKAVVDYLFLQKRAKRIICDPPITNHISQKVLKAAGLNYIRNIQSKDGKCAFFSLCRFPFIETNRLYVRLATSDDVQSLLDLHLENDFDHFKQWGPEIPIGFHELDFWHKRVARDQEEFLNDKSARFIFHLKNEKKIIGALNFTSFERGPFQNCRLGYKTHQDYIGKGYTTEALEGALNYVFEYLQFHRVEANFIPTNLSSRRVLEKLDFDFIGNSKEYLKINGQWQDHLMTYKNTHLPMDLFN